MEKIQVNFHKCVQNIQQFNRDDEFMYSEVFFSLLFPNGNEKNLSAIVKQNNGGDYKNDPVEIFFQHAHSLHIDYDQFRTEIEKYYRSLVGEGLMLKVKKGTERVKNNILLTSAAASIDYVAR